MSTPFSVVMSLYKSDDPEQFRAALASILDQTLIPAEVLVAIDGPIGPELEAVVAEAAHEPLVRFLRLEKNRGLGGSRQVAIDAASSDIIAVMDSDDLAVPDRFARQLPVLLETNVDVVGGYIEEFDVEPGDAGRIRKVPLTHDEILRFGRWRQPVNHVTIMFRRAAHEKAGGYLPIRGVEDFDLFHRMYVSGVRFANVPEVLVQVRCGDAVFERRRGMSYLKEELAVLRRMRESRFLSRWQWGGNVAVRLLTRLAPAPVLGLLYKAVLRGRQAPLSEAGTGAS